MKRIIAVLSVIGLGLVGFAGTCNLLNMSLNTIGGTDTYGGQLQNNTGVNFLAHSFKVTFVDINGTVVDTQSVSGCLRSWQNGASDFFSAASVQSAAVTANAIASIDASQPFVAGTTVGSSSALSSIRAVRNVTTLTVTGTLRNNDAVTLASPVVCAVVYNSSGQVVVTGKSSLGDLGTNGTTTFTVTFTVPNDSTIVNHVDVWADGLENSVPITPVSLTGSGVSFGGTILAFTTQPSGSSPGVSFASQPVVAVENSDGTIATASAAPVSLSITSGSGDLYAFLSCSSGTTVNAVNGYASFAGCSINIASGTYYSLTATSPNLQGAVSGSFLISPAAATPTFTTTPTPTNTPMPTNTR